MPDLLLLVFIASASIGLHLASVYLFRYRRERSSTSPDRERMKALWKTGLLWAIAGFICCAGGLVWGNRIGFWQILP